MTAAGPRDAASPAAAAADARAEIESNPLWYHTLELAPGAVTPGWFDLRSVIDKLPWPDVSGKRCLDVGTYDGQLAFELERRGAREVIATDIDDHDRWDWPPNIRARGVEMLEAAAGEKGAGFRIAKRLLGSAVERRAMSVYELDPAELGDFDVVVCGSLLLHLRDPLRALAAIRRVCRPDARFLSADEVELRLTVLHSRRPVARLDGRSDRLHWWLPNAAAHRQMLCASGFELGRSSGLYSIPFGAAHPGPGRSPRALAKSLGRRLATGGSGVPHQALLARPE
jgi:tRNA (mo5U34)-methyltransferase